ncbi:hypothetical protein PtrARCrB10_11820, partial [Pyrenophora tritici-repentis]
FRRLIRAPEGPSRHPKPRRLIRASEVIQPLPTRNPAQDRLTAMSLPDQTNKPRHSLPHPPTFSGVKSQWRGWKLEMEGKIEEDAEAIGNAKSQIRYVYSRLEGSARTNITTFFEMELRKNLPNPQALLDRLDLLYGERNRKEKAIHALHTIRQRDDEPFTSFYPRFEKEIANAEAESWNESSKISYLRNAIHPKLRAHLIGISRPELESYVAFATKCEEVSNQMELFGQWKNETRSINSRRSNTAQQALGENILREEMMEWEPTTTVRINAAQGRRNTNGYPSKRPEDQSLLGKRAKWVEKSEIEKRWKEGRCLRCGRDDCKVERCPLAAAIPPSVKIQKNVVSASRAKVTTAAVEDTEDEEISSSDQ